MHELGHVLGFDHDDAGAIPVMNGTLDPGAHYQLGTAGNTAASLGLAGFFAGADTAQQVIDHQSSNASIVTPPAKGVLTDGLGFSTSWIVVRAISLLDPGDDGRIYPYRVFSAYGGPLYGFTPFAASNPNLFIYSPGKIQQATINVPRELIRAVNLTPYSLDPTPGEAGDNMTYRPSNSDDIIYGGLANDFLHGGAGDDPVSGAKALVESCIGYFEPNNCDPVGVERSDYMRPFNPGNALAYGGRYAGEFGAYQEVASTVRIVLPGNRLYFSDLDAGEGPAAGTNGAGASVYSDGNDRLFGDLGNRWIVGGTGKDHATTDFKTGH
jgi:Ca2+-binding RTX toxin-like protein